VDVASDLDHQGISPETLSADFFSAGKNISETVCTMITKSVKLVFVENVNVDFDNATKARMV
jgi:hypothetical protein